MTTTTTVTFTLEELAQLRRAAADSGCYWHHLWQDIADGKRPDLDADSCKRISHQSWELWRRLRELEATLEG